MSKAVMIQGTGSHVGKSLITAGLCRVFRNMGYRVAPFKAQNMALNSAVSDDGGEIGRAQAVQAEACGIKSSVHMNPVLLKPCSDNGSQVIIHGKPLGNMTAREYYAFKETAWAAICKSYEIMSCNHDLIIIEGAGSPAEINLRDNDIVNMKVAELADAAVILVSDIDRGGVFASIIGTMELLHDDEKKRITGFIINKFRGDKTLLDPGLNFLETRTGVPVLGVLPYIKHTGIGEEDSLGLDKRFDGKLGGVEDKDTSVKSLKVGVIKLPHISNFTDFDPIQVEPDVKLIFADRPEELSNLDLIIIPGSKNTISDLRFMRLSGISDEVKKHHDGGGHIMGICGGYQMLGISVSDPDGVETGAESSEEEGLGLLETKTVLLKEKITANVEAVADDGSIVRGYEIHMGDTVTMDNSEPLFLIRRRNGEKIEISDGAVSADGRCRGTYIHGIFDNKEFRRNLLNGIRICKGMKPVKLGTDIPDAYERLAKVIHENIDMRKITAMLSFSN